MSKIFSRNHIVVVGSLLIITLWALQTCNDKNIIIVQKNISLAAKTDSIQQAQKEVDSVARVRKLVSDVATVVARTNKLLLAENDSLREGQQQPSVLPDTEQAKAVQRFARDISYLKTDVQMLAAQRDNLIALNHSLSLQADSIARKIAVVTKTDTVRMKERQPAFDAPYFLGRKGNQAQLPHLQVNANFQFSYNWLLRSPSIGIGTNIYLRHLRIYNGFYYSFGRQQIGATSAGAYDFFNLYKSKQ